MKPVLRCAGFFLGYFASLLPGLAATHRIEIAPAAHDRLAQVVTIALPAAARTASALRADDGSMLPLQVDPDLTARFIVPSQPRGVRLGYTVVPATTPGGPGVQVTKGPAQLQVAVAGAPVLAYQMDRDAVPRPDIKPEYKRAGYLHPVFTPSGNIVSDDYPPQHVHHHGIWSPWTKTAFQGREPDFWNMGKKTGTVEFAGLDWTWSGPVHGGFVARHRFVDLSAPSPVTALHEVWQVVVYAVADVRVFDLILTQVCATDSALHLPLYHYGGLGYRGPGEWYGKDKANFLTSEGETDRVKANARKMRWVHVSGAVKGGTAGVAVLGHPGNFRAPQPVRVHPNEPYVSFTPSQDGDWKIEPGAPYVARYRFIAADGPPDRSKLDAWWTGYALPAEATIRTEP
jgi:hypothetical protein